LVTVTVTVTVQAQKCSDDLKFMDTKPNSAFVFIYLQKEKIFKRLPKTFQKDELETREGRPAARLHIPSCAC
jgi:hypothetical protein